MTVDKVKIRQKLQFMRQELRELQRFQSMNLEQFKTERLYEAAATRMLQVSIEAVLDICAHVITREGWGLPKTYGEVIKLAASNGLIPAEQAATFRDMARFRNRVVHLYDDVDVEEIWDIIQHHLGDFKPFMSRVITEYLDNEQ